MHGETEARWASLVGDMLCTVSHGITVSGKCCLSNPRESVSLTQEPVTLSTTALLSSGSF